MSQQWGIILFSLKGDKSVRSSLSSGQTHVTLSIPHCNMDVTAWITVNTVTSSDTLRLSADYMLAFPFNLTSFFHVDLDKLMSSHL